jgi:hypothetical protein
MSKTIKKKTSSNDDQLSLNTKPFEKDIDPTPVVDDVSKQTGVKKTITKPVEKETEVVTVTVTDGDVTKQTGGKKTITKPKPKKQESTPEKTDDTKTDDTKTDDTKTSDTDTASKLKPKPKSKPKPKPKTVLKNEKQSKKTEETVTKKINKKVEKKQKLPKAKLNKKTKTGEVEVDENGVKLVESSTRYFKMVYDNTETGRFSGNKPKQAANKALSAIIKYIEEKGEVAMDKTIFFGIKECTRNSRHKTYTYSGKREKLDTPIKVPIGKGENSKIIEYKFTNKVKKYKADTSDNTQTTVTDTTITS